MSLISFLNVYLAMVTINGHRGYGRKHIFKSSRIRIPVYSPSYGECSLAKVLMQKETPKPVATCLNESFITFLFT